MQQPTRLISTPFAQEGEKTEIQNVTGEFDNSATYRLGFPPLTMQSIRSGGKPPKGTDFNGVLFDITENISFLCKGGRYQYNSGLSTLIGGYPEGSNLLLDDNVTEVVSTVAGNQNNPNTNMTGWILKPNKTTAVNVADASGETQQQVNYNGGSKWHSRVGGYQENERVVLTNGDIVKSTVDGNVNDPNVDMTGWVKVNDASQIKYSLLSNSIINELNHKLSERVSVKDFGAVGDGVTDDRPAIQAAIDYAVAFGGCNIYFPRSSTYYAIKSTHPNHPDSALVLDAANSGDNIYRRGKIKFIGEFERSEIKLDVPTVIKNHLYIKGRSNFLSFDSIWINADRKAQYTINGSDEFHPFLQLNKCRIRRGTVAALDVATYVSNFTLTLFEDCGVDGTGLIIKAPASSPSGPNTSLSMQSCYALNCGTGYDFGFMTYISLNACACDEAEIGYKFANAYGVTMNGCGAERVRQPVLVNAYRGFMLNTFYMLDCGGSVAEPQDVLIEFKSGIGATASGIRTENPRPYNYILGSTGSEFGSESVTVLDNSVRRDQAKFVTTINSDRPIKFLIGDSSRKNLTINVSSVADLIKNLRLYALDFELNHEITIQLADGIYNIPDDNLAYIRRVYGNGRLTIQGNSSNREAVKVYNIYRQLQVDCCTAKIRFKDLTISCATSNNGNERLYVNNSPSVYLDNVLITKAGLNVGVGCNAVNGSNVYIQNSTIIDSSAFATATWRKDASSKFIIQGYDAIPTSGAWSNGMRINFDTITAAGGYGAVCTASGLSGTWLVLGA